MVKLTHAILLGALIAAPVAVYAQQSPQDAQRQYLNDMRDRREIQSTVPNAGPPPLPPSPTLSEQVQQRVQDNIEQERTTGMPANSPAPRGLTPNPSPADQHLQRLKDEADERGQQAPVVGR